MVRSMREQLDPFCVEILCVECVCNGSHPRVIKLVTVPGQACTIPLVVFESWPLQRGGKISR